MRDEDRAAGKMNNDEHVLVIISDDHINIQQLCVVFSNWNQTDNEGFISLWKNQVKICYNETCVNDVISILV